MPNYWIGVASRDHVLGGIEGGFCQFCHGKGWPLKKLKPGDGIIYYSPRELMKGGKPVKAFTAIGKVEPGNSYQREQAKDFVPTRRNVNYYSSRPASILPLLPKLSFTKGKRSWGFKFRYGFFQITESDYYLIKEAMKVDNVDKVVAPKTADLEA